MIFKKSFLVYKQGEQKSRSNECRNFSKNLGPQALSTIFLSFSNLVPFVFTEFKQGWIEPRSPRPLANTTLDSRSFTRT